MVLTWALCVVQPGPENSGHVCELSDPDHFRDPQDLKARHGFFYVAFEVRGHRLNHELHRVFSSFLLSACSCYV